MWDILYNGSVILLSTWLCFVIEGGAGKRCEELEREAGREIFVKNLRIQTGTILIPTLSRTLVNLQVSDYTYTYTIYIRYLRKRERR